MGCELSSDTISAAASVVGSLVAAAGFYFTVHEIRQARHQLQAANEYQIRSDGRAIASEQSLYLSRECLSGLPACETDLPKTKIALGIIFNFYQSVYNQAQSQGVSPKFEEQMSADFCRWFGFSVPSMLWDSSIESGLYGEERQIMKEIWCD